MKFRKKLEVASVKVVENIGGGCGGHGSCGLGWKLQGFVCWRRAEHLAHGLDVHVSALHLPLVAGLEQDGPDEADASLKAAADEENNADAQ